MREYRTDGAKIAAYVLLGLIMTAIPAWLLFVAPSARIEASLYRHFMIWVAFAFFGGCSLFGAGQLIRAGDVILRLSAEGVWVKLRTGSITVPWSMIDQISEWKMRASSFIVLELTEKNFRALELTNLGLKPAKMSEKPNVKEIAIYTTFMSVSHDDVRHHMEQFWKKARQVG